MPGPSVRGMRTPSFAARSTRSRHHRRRLAAVAVASVIATLAVATPGRAPVVRADAPPQYYANALGAHPGRQLHLPDQRERADGRHHPELPDRAHRRPDRTSHRQRQRDHQRDGRQRHADRAAERPCGPHRRDDCHPAPVTGWLQRRPERDRLDRHVDRRWVQLPRREQIAWVNVGGTTTPLPDLDETIPVAYPDEGHHHWADRGYGVHGRRRLEVRHLAERRDHRPWDVQRRLWLRPGPERIRRDRGERLPRRAAARCLLGRDDARSTCPR